MESNHRNSLSCPLCIASSFQ